VDARLLFDAPGGWMSVGSTELIKERRWRLCRRRERE
jgi:hypothetical protein